MESTSVFDSRIASCVRLLPDISMASKLEKKCLLCNVKEIDGSCLVDSQESSLILCKVFNVPHLMNDFKKHGNISYCQPCKIRILKINESLEILKKLEEEVLKEKYLIRLQLESNNKVIDNGLNYSSWDFGVQLVHEMRFKPIKSKFKKVVKNQIDRKFCSKTTNYRIRKNITITEKLKHGTFEGHISRLISPEESTIARIDNIVSRGKQPFINDNISLPINDHFVDSAANSSFSHVELPLRSHIYDFEDIKLEVHSAESNNPTDTKDPFEGIVPEPGFVTEESTTPKTFTCGTCEINFDDYNQLEEHCLSHIGSKSFRLCPNEFVSEASLNTNSYIHVNNLKCKHCMKVFSHHSGLKRHELRHTGEKPFKCSYCEKSFSVRDSIIKHERIHTGEKPFKCRYCENTFAHISNRISHERVHTGEKPFKCGYCDKTFRHHYNTRRHELIHRGVKPFKCKFCEKSFSRMSGIEVHERIHTETC